MAGTSRTDRLKRTYFVQIEASIRRRAGLRRCLLKCACPHHQRQGTPAPPVRPDPGVFSPPCTHCSESDHERLSVPQAADGGGELGTVDTVSKTGEIRVITSSKEGLTRLYRTARLHVAREVLGLG